MTLIELLVLPTTCVGMHSNLITKPFFGTATIRELILLDYSGMEGLTLFES